jgi:hypothetical protein
LTHPKLSNINSNETKIISIEEFQNKEYFSPVFVKKSLFEKWEGVMMLVLFIILDLFISWLVLADYLDIRKSRKYNALPTSETIETDGNTTF